MMLTWGGRDGVANKRPAKPTDPADPAYEWSRYDQAIESASRAGMEVLLTIVGTPSWANGGLGPAACRRALRRPSAEFAYAAARRYSGTFLDTATGRILPRVGMWLAWNEPNSPVFLQPQFARVGGKWQMAAAAAYAQICNAVYSGVHAAGGPERVACGATAPRGYNDPTSSRPSISPLSFLRAAKGRASATSTPGRTIRTTAARARPRRRATSAQRAVGLGNIDTLISEVTSLYGRKPLWITEYGYQTKPPDDFFGVTWTKQADVPPPGIRDRAGEPAHRPLHVVPAQGQPVARKLAIGVDHGRRPQEAGVRRLRSAARRPLKCLSV